MVAILRLSFNVEKNLVPCRQLIITSQSYMGISRLEEFAQTNHLRQNTRIPTIFKTSI